MRALPTALAAALALLASPAPAAPARAERGALHGTIRWWEGTPNSWEEVTVTATWKRPQFKAREERTSWVADDADTFCGASGTIAFRSHFYAPRAAAKPDELKDPKKREEARKRLMRSDQSYSVPVQFNDDQVDLCVAIHPKTHRVLGRIRVDQKGGHFVVEPPWWNTFNNSVALADIQTTEVNALGEEFKSGPRDGFTSLYRGAFFDQGTGLTSAGGVGRWERGQTPEPDQEEKPKRIVEWNLQPGAAGPASLEVAGCGDLELNGSATLTARASPTGGRYRWTVDGRSAGVKLEPPDGAATAVTCGEPGHALVQVAYTAPDGQRQETSKAVSCISLEQPASSEPVPVPLGDELGKQIERWPVPVQVRPPGALDLLQFEPDDAGIATAEVDATGLQVKGLKEGTTGLQARSKCGAVVGLPLPVKVVPCHPDVVARLERERTEARRRMEAAARRIGDAIGSKEFERATREFSGDTLEAGYTLVDAMMAFLPMAGAAAQAKNVWSEATQYGKVVEAGAYAVLGDTSKGEKFVLDQWVKDVAATRASTKSWLEAHRAFLKLEKAGAAAAKLARDLGTAFGASEEVNQQLQDLYKNSEQVLKLGAQLKRCRPKTSSPEPTNGTDPEPPNPGNKDPRRPDPRGKPPKEGKVIDVPPDAPPPEPPPETPPRPPPQPPPRPPQVGLPIACSCPTEEKVTWTIAGRTVEVATIKFDGLANCSQDLKASLERLGEPMGAMNLALAATDGIEWMDPAAQKAALEAARGHTQRALTGLNGFGTEVKGVPEALKRCQGPARKEFEALKKQGQEAAKQSEESGKP